MRNPRRRALLIATCVGATCAAGLAVPCADASDSRARRFRPNPAVAVERELAPGARERAPGEAPTGFDDQTNGLTPQGPPFEEIDEESVVPLRSFNDDRFVFEEVETIEDGLGPTYNAQACRECHQNVVTGGASQIAEQRSGRVEDGEFFESQGGSLIHSRATHAELVERPGRRDAIRTFRISTSTLGDGFVEAIANQTLLELRDAQPLALRGTATVVPVLEADGAPRIGRFGWKSQHASLESFAADAYLNEMGITTPLLPDENTAGGTFVGFGTPFDPVADPEDDGVDVLAFASFMRATKAPARGPETADVRAGERTFERIGCAVCHVPEIATAPAGTAINGGALRVPDALGDKRIHPYGDFLLHDVGTGDGIPVLPGAAYAQTARQMRTAPLWGLRTRNRLMHDGLATTPTDAIARHAGQASASRARFQHLSREERARLLAFLDSL